MNKSLLIMAFALFATFAFAQDRVSATLPQISAIAKGRINEATGWLQNDNGEWLSRKNKIPTNLSGKDKILLDYQHDGLGENRENFIYLELRDVTINDSTYTILIKKHKDGYYKYESIHEGWVPQTSIIYYVFKTSELDKLKNLEVNKSHTVRINTIYSNIILYVDPKASINTVARDLYKRIQEDMFNMFELEIHLKIYKGNMRFTIQNYEEYSSNDFEKAYYETPLINFEKLIKLK